MDSKELSCTKCDYLNIFYVIWLTLQFDIKFCNILTIHKFTMIWNRNYYFVSCRYICICMYCISKSILVAFHILIWETSYKKTYTQLRDTPLLKLHQFVNALQNTSSNIVIIVQVIDRYMHLKTKSLRGVLPHLLATCNVLTCCFWRGFLFKKLLALQIN